MAKCSSAVGGYTFFGAVLVGMAGCSSADPTAPPALPGDGLTTQGWHEVAGVDPAPSDAKVHWQKGQQPGSSGPSPLVDHGGRVLPTSNTYAIWWGDQSAFPADAKTGVDAVFQGVSGTTFLGIANQYMRGSSSTSTFVTNWADTSAPPLHGPQVSTIGAEVCRAIAANGAAPDPSAVYFVFTSNFPNVRYCAWHAWASCGGQTIQVAYMPNTAGVAGCDPGDLFGCNTYSQGARSLANVTSHEFMEAVTDATGSAWFDSSGNEIGDKCAWTFHSCVSLTTGSWQLQEEWSNAASGCVQQ